MKKQVAKHLIRFALASLLLATVAPVMAQDGIRSTPPAVSINYIGTVDNQPIFQIEFDNKNEELFNLSIKDDQGIVLFNEKFKDKKFSKKFQLEKPTEDNVKLTFTIAADKEKQSQSFEINTNVRVIQDVVVTRL